MKTYLQTRQQNEISGSALPYAAERTRGIFGNLRLLVGTAVIVALIGTLHALSIVPVYQANMLIQIMRGGPVAGEPTREIPAATEVEILRSRSILAGVVEALKLDIQVEPRRFPVLGVYIASKTDHLTTPGVFGKGGYVWGAEHAVVTRFNMPEALMRHAFMLTATKNNGFVLTQEELGISMSGRVGEAARAATSHGEIDIFVSELQGRPGARFQVTRTPLPAVVEQLQRSLAISENGKQSDVIGVSLKGTNPELISRILNAIGQEYIRLHASQRSDQVAEARAFYNQRLEESRALLRKLDAQSAQVLGRHGAYDLAEDSQILSQRSSSLQDRLIGAEQEKAELSSRYMEQHPTMIAVNEKIQNLRRELGQVQAKRRSLAAADQEIISVAREKQINSEINAGLLNVRHKLEEQASSSRNHVRLIDRAEIPTRSTTLGLPAMIILACLAGIFAGILASILKNAMTGPDKRQTVPRYDGQFRLV